MRKSFYTYLGDPEKQIPKSCLEKVIGYNEKHVLFKPYNESNDLIVIKSIYDKYCFWIQNICQSFLLSYSEEEELYCKIPFHKDQSLFRKMVGYDDVCRMISEFKKKLHDDREYGGILKIVNVGASEYENNILIPKEALLKNIQYQYELQDKTLEDYIIWGGYNSGTCNSTPYWGKDLLASIVDNIKNPNAVIVLNCSQENEMFVPHGSNLEDFKKVYFDPYAPCY